MIGRVNGEFNAPLIVPLLSSSLQNRSPSTTAPCFTLMLSAFSSTPAATSAESPTVSSTSEARVGPGLASITITLPERTEEFCFSQMELEERTTDVETTPSSEATNMSSVDEDEFETTISSNVAVPPPYQPVT